MQSAAKHPMYVQCLSIDTLFISQIESLPFLVTDCTDELSHASMRLHPTELTHSAPAGRTKGSRVEDTPKTLLTTRALTTVLELHLLRPGLFIVLTQCPRMEVGTVVSIFVFEVLH